MFLNFQQLLSRTEKSLRSILKTGKQEPPPEHQAVLLCHVGDGALARVAPRACSVSFLEGL